MSAHTLPNPTASPASSPATRFLGTIPGMALLFGIGLLGKLFTHTTALLQTRHPGMASSSHRVCPLGHHPRPRHQQHLRHRRIFRPGVATYELWLKLGIVLIGARFLMQDLFHIGGMTLGLVAIELILSLSVMTLLGRIFKLPPKLTSLLSIGSSVCGVTAIMATQGAIDPAKRTPPPPWPPSSPSAPSPSSPFPPSATPCT